MKQRRAIWWVSILDDLPDDETTVLVSLSNGEVDTGYIDAGIWRKDNDAPFDLYANIQVTHWADFPRPANQQSAISNQQSPINNQG